MIEMRARLRRIGWPVVLLLAGLCAGACLRPQPAATAGIREATPREHFLAGSERSVPVLNEISATLKHIDTRLARIEKTVADAAAQANNR